jgi:hypothetical protein
MNVDIFGAIFQWAGIILFAVLSSGFIPFTVTCLYSLFLGNKLKNKNVYLIDGFIVCVIIIICSSYPFPCLLAISPILMLVVLHFLSKMKYFNNRDAKTSKPEEKTPQTDQ